MTERASVVNSPIPPKGRQKIFYTNANLQAVEVRYQNAIISVRNVKDGT